MKFSKININIVLKRILFFWGGRERFFLFVFHLWKGSNQRTNRNNHTYTHLLTLNWNSVFVWWRGSGVHKSFQNFDVLRRHSSHQSKCGHWKTYYDTRSILQHFSWEQFSQSSGANSSDSASSRPLTSAGPRVLRNSINRTLSSYLFLNCLIFLYFELANYLMFSIFGKFALLAFI